MIKEFKVSHSITERTPTLTTYMQDISRYPLLTMAQEEELAILAQAGNVKAKQRLAECNLRFVISVAKQFIHLGIPLEDLIMEGNLGLMTAIEKFDPTRGFKLSTYAVWWIRQSILNALAEKGRTVRLPLNQVGLLLRVRRATQDFYQQNERNPLTEELAQILSLPVEKVECVLQNASTEFSLDKPMDDESDTCFVDTLESSTPAPDDQLIHDSLCADINRWLRIFDQKREGQRAKDILICSFGLNGMPVMSLEDLAIKHCITRERVRQIRESSIRLLKSHIPSPLASNL
jgi:RNA polymerase primary sigma factor